MNEREAFLKNFKQQGGKVLLQFHLQDFPKGMAQSGGIPPQPPHWRLIDASGLITCWGHCGNGSFESMAAIMRLAAIGVKHATNDELVEAGIRAKIHIWTPEDGGDDSMATHIGETGGFVDGHRQEGA